jgi:hypothetical protein
MRRYHQAMKKATVDNVSGTYADKGAKITIRPLRTDPKMILIEGDELAFEFLGRLFLAHAKAINGCGFSIEPHGAGSALHSKESVLGLALHRLPCDDPERWQG